jgi:hypothetical protein
MEGFHPLVASLASKLAPRHHVTTCKAGGQGFLWRDTCVNTSRVIALVLAL